MKASNQLEMQLPCILGSDGSGVVVEVGDESMLLCCGSNSDT